MDNATKETILKRLFDSVGVCTTCTEKGCPCSNKTLPTTLSVEVVLKAINLDECFFKEPATH